jgi:signal peptidase I
MAYKTGFFLKEFRQAYTEYRVSLRRMILFGAFLGLVSFAAHFLLQTVYQSVLTESLPELMLPSYFSVLFVYTLIAYVFFIVYFLTFYKYLTFSEIRDNSWYLLVKMGYKPISMILTKFAVRIISVIITYSVGYVVAILLTVILRYPFVPEYFLPVYISGLYDILIIVIITMTSSLFIKLYDSARIVIISAVFVLFALKIVTGYYAVVSNRSLMRSVGNLVSVKHSVYFLFFALFIVACTVVCIFRAKSIAMYYNVPSDRYPQFAVQDYKTNAMKIPAFKEQSVASKRINLIVLSVLIIIISISVLINLLVLVVSAMSPEKEVNIFGYIPYVFQSDSMEPAIAMNDLVFFEKVDSAYLPEVGDTVIFKSANEVFIERIITVNGSELIVNIDHYPELMKEDVMKREIIQDDIYGVYAGRNRWLGALILFANSFFGRLLLLLIPAILIFFYKPIVSFFRTFSKTEMVLSGKPPRE